MTEDGGLARGYRRLHEIIVQNGCFRDAYYFVHQSNAERFVAHVKSL